MIFRQLFVAANQFGNNTDTCAVYISTQVFTFDDHYATQVHVFADFCDQVVQSNLNRFTCAEISFF